MDNIQKAFPFLKTTKRTVGPTSTADFRQKRGLIMVPSSVGIFKLSSSSIHHVREDQFPGVEPLRNRWGCSKRFSRKIFQNEIGSPNIEKN